MGELIIADAFEIDETTSLMKKSSTIIITLAIALTISPFTKLSIKEASRNIPTSTWKVVRLTIIAVASVALLAWSSLSEVGIWPRKVEEQIEQIIPEGRAVEAQILTVILILITADLLIPKIKRKAKEMYKWIATEKVVLNARDEERK